MGWGEIAALRLAGLDDVVEALSQEGEKGDLLQKLFERLMKEEIKTEELHQLAREVDAYKKAHQRRTIH